MRSHLLLTLTGALVLCGVGLSASQEPVESAPELTAGIQAYKDARYEEAQQHFARAIAQDPENYYSVAVLDWTRCYQPRMEVRAKLNLKPEQPLIRLPECWNVRDANNERVSSGIEMLSKAIELKPD